VNHPPTVTPLHDAARAAFPSRTIRGFTLFAPAGPEDLVRLATRGHGLLIALNAEKLARANGRLRSIVNANVGYPDGMGAVLALRRKGVRARRSAGADLWKSLVAAAADQASFYLIGGTPDVVEQAAGKLRAAHPVLKLATHHGYLEQADVDRLCSELATRRPQIVLVAMGSPRQEILMERLYQAHPALYMGLGGSLDVLIGRKPRAPQLLQEIGLEWAYQFVRNPRRLHRLPAYLKFAVLLAAGRT
jgi:UDP-N-acetyl-D-mannosaminouronate:lipid I N-acetyl-D-mannosaminouronosyltransferase